MAEFITIDLEAQQLINTITQDNQATTDVKTR
ncbi:MAG: hypothetical protein ACI8WB_000190 [Phenylobacterium sp.]|jgi:hypothetical protein